MWAILHTTIAWVRHYAALHKYLPKGQSHGWNPWKSSSQVLCPSPGLQCLEEGTVEVDAGEAQIASLWGNTKEVMEYLEILVCFQRLIRFIHLTTLPGREDRYSILHIGKLRSEKVERCAHTLISRRRRSQPWNCYILLLEFVLWTTTCLPFLIPYFSFSLPILLLFCCHLALFHHFLLSFSFFSGYPIFYCVIVKDD